LDELIYLDNATTTWPKPGNVYSFFTDFYRNLGVSPGRSSSSIALKANKTIENLRLRLTRFFGGDEDAPERLCFSYNATDALNLIIQGMLSDNDHVVTTNMEHNSVIRPINHLIKDRGVSATFVPFGSDGYIDPDEIKKAIKPNTKLVVVNHGSNVLGTIQPVKEIGLICKEMGVPLAVDSSQTAGVIPINMKDMNIDLLAFTGHKALMGCCGIGGLCVRKDINVRHTRSGGTGIKSAYPFQLEEYPYRLEFGTPNMIGVAALTAGQDWLEKTGMANVFDHENKLAKRLIDGLREINGVTIYCCSSLRNHLPTILINIKGVETEDVGRMLDADFKISTRAGLHCAPLVHQQIGTLDRNGGVRFSIGPFNTEEHIEKAIKAIAMIAKRI
jgi:cysteine desulfurase / selenocysteine lyase